MLVKSRETEQTYLLRSLNTYIFLTDVLQRESDAEARPGMWRADKGRYGGSSVCVWHLCTTGMTSEYKTTCKRTQTSP